MDRTHESIELEVFLFGGVPERDRRPPNLITPERMREFQEASAKAGILANPYVPPRVRVARYGLAKRKEWLARNRLALGIAAVAALVAALVTLLWLVPGGSP